MHLRIDPQLDGKEAPQKVLEYAQYVGFFILIALMLYANGNDLLKALGWV
jgi:regulator of sigma E protease